MLFIGGQWTESSTGKFFDSTDPATGEVLGQAADGTREDMKRAIAAAQDAFPAWSAKTAYERAAILMKAFALMNAQRDELATLMTKEQGKPIRMARTEVGYAADFLSWFAEEAKRVYGQTIPSSRANHRFMVLQQPVGVAAAITPWNYPISMLTRKIGPALAAGNTV
ncbi:MAG TPA: succinate-semialdehyde dehydrogenase (NADP(+)), partial [Actinobacteria bacterium]|nr:succinate-semialdehyde dehydrogenase (NADP(+)) [Actinomycetota bacterium]